MSDPDRYSDPALSMLDRFRIARENPEAVTQVFRPAEVAKIKEIMDRGRVDWLRSWPGNLTTETERLPVVDKSLLTPGAAPSIARGCLCSELLNAYGAGVRETVGDEPVSVAWLVAPDCPMHERIETPPVDGPEEAE